MTNTGMKKNKNSIADAENYLKYLDGTAYTHIPGLILGFNDRDGPNPFRIIENDNGELLLADAPSSKSYEVLCQYDCQGKWMNMLLKIWGIAMRSLTVYLAALDFNWCKTQKQVCPCVCNKAKYTIMILSVYFNGVQNTFDFVQAL